MCKIGKNLRSPFVVVFIERFATVVVQLLHAVDFFLFAVLFLLLPVALFLLCVASLLFAIATLLFFVLNILGILKETLTGEIARREPCGPNACWEQQQCCEGDYEDAPSMG